MMRTNSHGSVVSTSDLTHNADTVDPPPTVTEEQPAASDITGASLTPPEVFTSPGDQVKNFETMETTPKGSLSALDDSDEPTPRASSRASNRTGYIYIPSRK